MSATSPAAHVASPPLPDWLRRFEGSRQDLSVVTSFLANPSEVPPEWMDAILQGLLKIFATSKSERNRLRASAEIRSWVQRNDAVAFKLLDKTSPDQHEVVIGTGHMIREVLDELGDNERLERLAEEDAASEYPRYLGASDHAGEVAAGSALAGDQPGGDGHDLPPDSPPDTRDRGAA